MKDQIGNEVGNIIRQFSEGRAKDCDVRRLIQMKNLTPAIKKLAESPNKNCISRLNSAEIDACRTLSKIHILREEEPLVGTFTIYSNLARTIINEKFDEVRSLFYII